VIRALVLALAVLLPGAVVRAQTAPTGLESVCSGSSGVVVAYGPDDVCPGVPYLVTASRWVCAAGTVYSDWGLVWGTSWNSGGGMEGFECAWMGLDGGPGALITGSEWVAYGIPAAASAASAAGVSQRSFDELAAVVVAAVVVLLFGAGYSVSRGVA